MLLGGNEGETYTSAKVKEKDIKPFELPPKNNDMHRVFAYLMKSRFIDGEVISFFAKEKLLYESKEQSKDLRKEYHNAIFVGYDERGVPCHAHKRGIYTKGKAFKGNIDSSNPCYSFHYFGTSERIYVFEAPIDVLSFITLHKNTNWKKHSYLALCGLSEQALFKMLEINSGISHIVLCLDHDSAGIETCEKITDMLIEKNITYSRLLSVKKDWNEDLKNEHNLQSTPAQEHPHHIIKDELCKEILMLVKEIESVDINHSDGVNSFLESKIQNDSQAEVIKNTSAIFLCLAKKEYRQLGEPISANDIVAKMSLNFRTYQNRTKWDPKLSNVETVLSDIKMQNGIISESEKLDRARKYECIALELLKSVIKLQIIETKQIKSPVLKMS